MTTQTEATALLREAREALISPQLRERIDAILSRAESKEQPNAEKENDCRGSSESERLLQGSGATESAGYLSQGSPVQTVPAHGNDSLGAAPAQSAGGLTLDEAIEREISWRAPYSEGDYKDLLRASYRRVALRSLAPKDEALADRIEDEYALHGNLTRDTIMKVIAALRRR